MRSRTKTVFVPVRQSLGDLLGGDYVEAVAAAKAELSRPAGTIAEFRRLTRVKVDFFPAALNRRLIGMLGRVGQRVSRPLSGQAGIGATSRAFDAATKRAAAPLSGLGYYRVGEDGRLYFLSKSEHYHAPLGHSFPGYGLVDIARRLGVPNATHNNTRGHITRRLEEELVRTANGLVLGDRQGLARLLSEGLASSGSASPRPRQSVALPSPAAALSRVLNLETGSLSAEAGIKLMLARFYRLQDDSPRPVNSGRVPVILVAGDDAGGLTANYHGTTMAAQVLRGMWPQLRAGLEEASLLKVVPVRPNNIDDLDAAFARFDRGRHRIAGLVLELVLMNYGGRRLAKSFVRRAASLCRRHGAPLMIDEIQTCAWSPQLFMFREYGIRPDMVAVGKGFPGGEYPASRILFTAALDSLSQFGALVTNGQEELASLSYLVTIRWTEANAAVTEAVGTYYRERLEGLAKRFSRRLSGVEGCRHLAALCFRQIDNAREFVKVLSEGGLDISIQAYKLDCPPVALTKLPLIVGFEAVDLVVDRMAAALARL